MPERGGSVRGVMPRMMSLRSASCGPQALWTQALTSDELASIKTTVDPDLIELVWVGDEGDSGVAHDLVLPTHSIGDAVEAIKRSLGERGIIYVPW